MARSSRLVVSGLLGFDASRCIVAGAWVPLVLHVRKAVSASETITLRAKSPNGLQLEIRPNTLRLRGDTFQRLQCALFVPPDMDGAETLTVEVLDDGGARQMVFFPLGG